ncbi:MAG TPA: ABC transporter permease [Jatrophihabitantaceae bacterium]|nr:ABC transporter permease [Jatrophihabitantaceae bacterium]
MKSRTFTFGFDRFSGLYLWALFIVVFGVWKSSLFLTEDTLHSIAASQAIVAMLGIAVLVPLAAGVFDLSVGSTINLSAVTVAVLQTNHHYGMWTSIAIAVLVGVAIGVINGFLVVVLGISSFIATLGTATVFGAVQAIVANQSQPLPPTSAAWLQLTQRQAFGFQIVFVYLLVLAVLIWWLLEHTPAGRYLYAVGGNSEAARLSGVRVGKWVWLSFVCSGTICGIAGVFYSSLNGPSLTFGAGLLLPAYAAAFLGSTQLRPGRFNVWGTVIAVYVLATGVRGLQLVTTVQWLNDMFNGVALVAAVGFAVWRQKKAATRRQASRDAPGHRPREARDDTAHSPALTTAGRPGDPQVTDSPATPTGP